MSEATDFLATLFNYSDIALIGERSDVHLSLYAQMETLPDARPDDRWRTIDGWSDGAWELGSPQASCIDDSTMVIASGVDMANASIDEVHAWCRANNLDNPGSWGDREDHESGAEHTVKQECHPMDWNVSGVTKVHWAAVAISITKRDV